MARWAGSLIRADLHDIGDYPRRNLGQLSPDVFDWGTKTAPNPAELSWTEYVGGRTVAEEINYLYVRGLYNSSKSVEARVRLYQAPVELIPWPTLPDGQGWGQNQLKTTDGEAAQDIELTEGPVKWVAPKPFELTPLPGQGYSLVGCVGTDAQPNPVPSVQNIVELAKYFREHPDTSVFHLQQPATHPEPRHGWHTAVRYYQGAMPTGIYFSIRLTGGRAGDSFRLGSISDNDVRPQPPVARTWQVNGDRMDESLHTKVPAKWDAQLTLDYIPVADSDGVPVDLVVTLTAYAVTDLTDPEAEHAVDPAEAGIPAADLGSRGLLIDVGALRFEPMARGRP